MMINGGRKMNEVKTIKLSETVGMMKAIATQHIRIHGEYTCNIDGQKVRVIAD